MKYILNLKGSASYLKGKMFPSPHLSFLGTGRALPVEHHQNVTARILTSQMRHFGAGLS